jgi:hypothetical protein
MPRSGTGALRPEPKLELELELGLHRSGRCSQTGAPSVGSADSLANSSANGSPEIGGASADAVPLGGIGELTDSSLAS